MYPVKGFTISSSYGSRPNLFGNFHNGVDFKTPIGTPINAISDGKILVSKMGKGYGYYILIEHDGYCSLYAHLREKGLDVGTKVFEGDIIGYTGNTGDTTGPHLHFEIRDRKYQLDFFVPLSDGRQPYTVDPIPFLDKLDVKVDDVSKWAIEARDWCVKNGISDGKNPKGLVTREQAWTMLNALYKKIKSEVK